MKILKALLTTGIIAVGLFSIGYADYFVGDQGNEVRMLQQRLIKAGYDVTVDGVYGQGTARAVKLFQKNKKLTVDGVVGDETYRELTGRTMPTIKSGSKANGRHTPVKVELKSKGNKENKKKESNKNHLEHINWNKTYTLTGKEQGIMNEAKKYIGIPYRFGGTDVNGFDCSGFIQYVFNRQGIKLPRSADEQYSKGKYVPINSLEPGDLVFFSTYTEGVSHSGIYVGNGDFISATTSKGIIVSDMKSGYWFERYIGAKRIL